MNAAGCGVGVALLSVVSLSAQGSRPSELHIYQEGGHGLEMAPEDPVFSSWTNRLRDWLDVQGLLDTNE